METLLFGSFQLHPRRRTLVHDGKPVRLGTRALDILITLCERAGEVVTKEELIAAAWPESVVEEGNLRVHIAALRKSLSDGRNGARFISNAVGRGYCFVAAVERVSEQSAVDASVVDRHVKLPTAIGRIFGREATIETLVTELPSRRLVTLLGSGGIGKTTIALAVLERLVESYPDGACFVDLALLSDPLLVPSGLATALGIGIATANPLAGPIAYLECKQMLIVLDGCEHVIDAVTQLVEKVLQAASGVTILTTSREPLRAAGEWAHRILPLDLPPNDSPLTVAEVMHYAAVQLFVERATASTGTFALVEAGVPLVTKICRRLDGIPLALELAAANIDPLGLHGLASHLDRSFSVLTRGRRTALPRQQTLEATLDWSYNTLTPAEQLLIRRLAVFSGRFSVKAAIAIASEPAFHDLNILDELFGLVSKSLVNVDTSGDLISYRLLESTRAYALGKLIETGERTNVERRFAEYLRELFDESDSELDALRQNDWLAIYGCHVDDVRAALDWATSPVGDLWLAASLTTAAIPVWVGLSLMSECRDRILCALSEPVYPLCRGTHLDMKLNIALGVALLYTSGPSSESLKAMLRGLELATTLDSAEYQYRATWALAAYYGGRGEYGQLLTHARALCALAERTRNAVYWSIGDRRVGDALHYRGDQKAASDRHERMIALYDTSARWSHMLRFLYDQQVTARVVLTWGQWLQGIPEQACHTAALAVADAEAIDHALSRCYALADAAAAVAFLNGDLTAAQASVEQLMSTAARNGLGVWRAYGACLEAAILVRRGGGQAELRRLGDAVESLRAMNFRLRRPFFLSVLAEGYLAIDQVNAGQEVLDEAIAECERDEAGCYLAELFRVRGELVLKENGVNAAAAAERQFLQALVLAEKQGALSWMLRAAYSLASHWRRSGRLQEAFETLSSVYGKVTEGFETHDLRAARNLLIELSAQKPALVTPRKKARPAIRGRLPRRTRCSDR